MIFRKKTALNVLVGEEEPNFFDFKKILQGSPIFTDFKKN